MQTSTLVLILLILAALAYQAGRMRSLALVGGLQGARKLHSRPGYYGLLTALACAIPSLLVLGLWHAFDGRIITGMVVSSMSPETQALSAGQLSLVLNDVHNLVAGAIPAEMASQEVQAAAWRPRRCA
jgi:phosphate transport system permease protein